MEHCFDGAKCYRGLLWHEYGIALCWIFAYCVGNIYIDNDIAYWLWFVHYRPSTRVLKKSPFGDFLINCFQYVIEIDIYIIAG